jgi:hypothetical protein
MKGGLIVGMHNMDSEIIHKFESIEDTFNDIKLELEIIQ